MFKLNDYFEKTIGLPIIYHDYETYDWNSAKFGTIVVDPKENNIGIKLRYNVDNRDPKDPFSTYGPSWVALKIRGDETVIVEESSRMLVDKIVFIKYDMVEGKLYYTVNGKNKVSDATRQNNFIFELDKGQYIPGNNHIKALINNTIECSPATRTLKELDSTHIVLNSNDLEQGCEIDVYYVERYDIKNPVPRIFNQEEEPANPESGDFWINSKTSDTVKQPLPLTVFIRYDYNAMQLLVLIKTINGSNIVVEKDNVEVVNRKVDRAWSTFRIPINYNETFNIRVEGSHDWYHNNVIIKEVYTSSKVDIALFRQEPFKDYTILHLQGDEKCNFTVLSSEDFGNTKFEEYEPGKYKIKLPRKTKSYFIDVIAKKADKLQTKINGIVVRSQDPVEIPIEITSKKIRLVTLDDQYADITVTTKYKKEPKIIANSNYPEGLTLANKVVNNDETNYFYSVKLNDGIQYLSFMADDKENNALSKVISTVLGRRKNKEIPQEYIIMDLVSNKIPKNKYYTIKGNKYIRMSFKALENSVFKITNLNKYNFAEPRYIGRSNVDVNGYRQYSYLIPVDVHYRDEHGNIINQINEVNISRPHINIGVHIEDNSAVDCDYVINLETV